MVKETEQASMGGAIGSDGPVRRLVSEQTVRFYDAEAADYDALRYRSPGGQRVDAFHRRVVSEALMRRLSADAAVLELGCGTGRLLEQYRAEGRRLVGIDASAGMLRVCRAHTDAVVPIVQGSAYALPFGDESFDAVYSVLVLNLLDDLAHALSEVARVLRPGGLFLFNMPNLGSVYWPGGVYVNLRGRTTGRNAAGYRYSQWLRRGRMIRLVERTGLRVRDVLGQPPMLSRGLTVRPMRGGALSGFLCKSLFYLAEKAR